MRDSASRYRAIRAHAAGIRRKRPPLAERFDTLESPAGVGRRTLTAFRRRHCLLSSPTVKLLEQLLQLTAEPR
ncbi:hypothetical protein K6W84_05410 [Burkholderia cepacia]|uniref:hypothetical protein n=1 Tax=Burkholderia cepacia TaxID=292 RepID=UPI000A8FA885|nr:hypothetical protein [Burkholderia cepacia]MBY4735589.1 hypothetical protein [Burkholderia cepacia]MBY4756010.1 hypothetical protein [Burkholderia cepacia]MBY4900242.1 hypothetical protein [Burkholderia cepacia]MDW9245642.1 transcriptional regulator, LysR family [Burkholderia cepacia]